MSTKLFTYEEVSQHNNRKDLWMIIDGKVYDITKFQDEHPGGDEVLLDEGAKDATIAFNDVGHTSDAVELLVKYYVGDIDPTSKPVKVVREDDAINGGPKGK
ncbi:cytochrome b5-like heme/steroid binding domain-containing protein [Pilobolus umbonatus]|nr:cytochrome b5-like heme/steroid binding domain-containing protein [Pilobolus umbonatus]